MRLYEYHAEWFDDGLESESYRPIVVWIVAISWRLDDVGGGRLNCAGDIEYTLYKTWQIWDDYFVSHISIIGNCVGISSLPLNHFFPTEPNCISCKCMEPITVHERNKYVPITAQSPNHSNVLQVSHSNADRFAILWWGVHFIQTHHRTVMMPNDVWRLWCNVNGIVGDGIELTLRMLWDLCVGNSLIRILNASQSYLQ